jgi:tRNA nucleotidyltransferase/poly(A) polymerase
MQLKDLINFKATRFIFDVLSSKDKQARFVGGCVRNSLLEQQVKDIDIGTTLLPDEIEELFVQYPNVKVIDIGKEYGTVMLAVDHHTYEITTLRKDVHTDGRYAIVEYTNDWEEDAARRDFTINGMSYSPKEDKLYDYFNGQEDLKAGLIKFIGDPHKRVEEDYLRILRLFRFYTYYGKLIDPASLAACKTYAKNMDRLSKERKMSELYRILAHDNYMEALELMDGNGILEHISSLPDWKAGMKLCNELENLCSNYGHAFTLPLKIFALFHRAGLTPSAIEKEFITLSKAEKKYLTALAKFVSSANLNEVITKPHYFVYHHREVLLDGFLYLEVSLHDSPPSSSSRMRGSRDTDSSQRSIILESPKHLDKALTSSRDFLSLDPRIREEDESDKDFSLTQLRHSFNKTKKLLKHEQPIFPLTGSDLMSRFSLEPGKKLGQLLEFAKNSWIESKFTADKESLLAQLDQQLK